MPPKITNPIAWEQAGILMQPAFIRIVDNIRKLLDESPWRGTYQDVLIWPLETTDETKALVTKLLEELEGASPQQASQIKNTLSGLPIPHPGYHLCLQRQEQTVSVDLWELCYQVCFQDYIPSTEDPVIVDTSLIDETGDVDWQRLDAKVSNLVKQVFANLPD
jgi:hypothetical protein